MAIYWPSSTSGCRVDILTVSLIGVENSLVCQGASRGEARAEAPNYFTNFLAVRNALTLITGSSKAITAVQSQAIADAKRAATSSINAAAAAIDHTADVALDGIRLQIKAADLANKSLVAQVQQSTANAIYSAQQAVGGLVNTAQSAVAGVVGTATDAVGNLVNAATSGVATAIDVGADALGTLTAAVTDGVKTAISLADGAVRNLIGAAQSGITAFIGTAGDVVGAAVGGVRDFIADLIHNVQTGIGGIVEKLTGIPGALIGVGADVIEAVGGAVADVIGGIVGGLGDPLSGIIGGFFHGEEPRLLGLVDSVYDRILANDAAPGDLKAMVADAKTPGAPVPAIIAAIVAPFLIITMLSTVLEPVITKVVQEERSAIRPSLFGLGDAVQAYYRGSLTRGQLAEQAAKAGYPDNLTEAALTLGRQLPTPTDLADWRHRGFIQDGAMVERLQEQGWDAADASNILDASEVIPPVGDLVRFAVREAFPGQTGYGGARGSGAPSRFLELAKMQGLDAEFARSYWAAHWELPSVTAAFAMYHRGLIDESDLRGLLREQDFAPEWVDRIISVAFDPLTRVDVRRMRALGVLTPSQVERAYRDLGYDATNARRLADFTEADIAASQRVETAPERDLTRADVVGAYADGILNRAQTKSALSDIGYDNDETELILDREDVRVLRAERKETRTAIVDQVVAGVIDEVAAQDKLNAAGYTEDEVKAALREIERKLAGQIKEPTKAELDKFRKFGVITDDEYRAELRRIGYSDRWVEAFILVTQASEVDNA